MNKHRKVWFFLFLLLTAVVLWIGYAFYSDQDYESWIMPEPNIEVQTQSVKNLTFSLRNASYTDEKISLGIEVTGGGQAENDLGYQLYDGDRKFASSVGGFIHNLGDQHEYVTVETDEVSDLSDPLDLHVKILARSNPLELHDLNADFHLELAKQK